MRKIIKVSATNILFKSNNEQDLIMTNFAKMLNSLKLPIQILFKTNNYNLRNKKLKIENQDYDKFLKSLVKENSFYDKEFYLVINNEDEQLVYSSMEIIKKYLKTCKLTCEEIKCKDLEEYIPDEFKSGYTKFKEYYTKTFYVEDWPYSAYCGWLTDIYNSELNIDISMNIEPINREESLKYLERKIAQNASNIIINDEDNLLSDEYDEYIKSAFRMREEILKNDGKMFFMSFYITLKEKTIDKLNKQTDLLKSLLSSMGIKSFSCLFRQDDGYRITEPIGNDILNKKYNFTTNVLKYFFPFISMHIMDEDGVLIGENLLTPGLIFLNPFIYNSALMFVLGKVGGGKTYLIQLLVLRLAYMGVQIDIWDQTNLEYQNLLKLCKLPNVKVHSYNSIELYEEEMIKYLDSMKDNLHELNPRMLIIDEGWKFISSDIICNGINEISLTGRKAYQGLCFITQMIEHLNDERILSILRQASIKAIMQMEPNSAKVVKDQLDLTQEEYSFLISAQHEGILFAGSKHVQFKALASKKEDKIITTDPRKRLKNKMKANKKKGA